MYEKPDKMRLTHKNKIGAGYYKVRATRMKSIIQLLFTILLLSSCQMEDTRVETPQPNDVSGRWEGFVTGKLVPYIQVYIDKDGSGFAIASDKERALKILEFDSFKSADKSFYVTAYFIEDGERTEPEIIEGVLDSGELCFYLPKEDEEEINPPFCFERYKKIKKYRKLANRIYRENT